MRSFGVAILVVGVSALTPACSCSHNAATDDMGVSRIDLTNEYFRAARDYPLGYRTLILSSEIEGETREIARMHAAIAREIVHSGRPLKAPACIITGGETTVTIKGDGLGGRNQEFVLAAAIDIAGLDRVVVFSAGTDGSDGPTDAAADQQAGSRHLCHRSSRERIEL